MLVLGVYSEISWTAGAIRVCWLFSNKMIMSQLWKTPVNSMNSSTIHRAGIAVETIEILLPTPLFAFVFRD